MADIIDSRLLEDSDLLSILLDRDMLSVCCVQNRDGSPIEEISAVDPVALGLAVLQGGGVFLTKQGHVHIVVVNTEAYNVPEQQEII